uniref:Uncharacterized protein n=1 Tax=Rhizophora mucronata TaxID=61149 RepID=A0A2P2NBM7_RHIMU
MLRIMCCISDLFKHLNRVMGPLDKPLCVCLRLY